MQCLITGIVNVMMVLMEMAALWILISLKSFLTAIMVSSIPEILLPDVLVETRMEMRIYITVGTARDPTGLFFSVFI